MAVCVYKSFGGRLEEQARAGALDAVFIDEAHRVTRAPAPRAGPRGGDDSDAQETLLSRIRGLIAARDGPSAGPLCVLLSATMAPPAATVRFD